MDIIGRFFCWLIEKSNQLPGLPSSLPVKLAGTLTYAGKRQRIRIAVRHDTDWDRHFLRAWQQKAYWYRRMGTRTRGNVQIADMVFEWRIGDFNG